MTERYFVIHGYDDNLNWRHLKMLTKEEVAKMSQGKVSALLKQKRKACRTCAQEGEMLFHDREYLLLRDRMSAILAENAAKKRRMRNE